MNKVIREMNAEQRLTNSFGEFFSDNILLILIFAFDVYITLKSLHVFNWLD